MPVESARGRALGPRLLADTHTSSIPIFCFVHWLSPFVFCFSPHEAKKKAKKKAKKPKKKAAKKKKGECLHAAGSV